MLYEELMMKLEDMLEECMHSGIKASDVDGIKDIVETLYKLNGLQMAERYGEYGESPSNSSMHGSFSARGRNARRDSRGRYMGRYGHDNGELVRDLEMKMADLTGEDQNIMRRAINIIERG